MTVTGRRTGGGLCRSHRARLQRGSPSSRLHFGYAFSTRWSAQSLLQYNSLDDAFSANVRLNLHRSGSALFLVLDESRGAEASLLRLSSPSVVATLTYLARL